MIDLVVVEIGLLFVVIEALTVSSSLRLDLTQLAAGQVGVDTVNVGVNACELYCAGFEADVIGLLQRRQRVFDVLIPVVDERVNRGVDLGQPFPCFEAIEENQTELSEFVPRLHRAEDTAQDYPVGCEAERRQGGVPVFQRQAAHPEDEKRKQSRCRPV